VRAEDRRFRSHRGVDWLALAAAARDLGLGRPRRGASTLSMQLAGLLGAAPRAGERGLLGKWRQLRAGLRLDARWSKDQILEAYLNRVPLRGELVGVAAGARALFGKAPHGLDAAEAHLLAALLRAPNAEPARVAERALALAARGGVALPADALRARARRVLAAPPGIAPPGAMAPRLAPHLAARLLRAGAGEDVRTTLDRDVQEIATRALRQQLLALDGRNVHDGAVLVVENRSGDVLAWVGSSGDLSPARFVDGVRARRQAGSTLKPFLYALAFERRLLTPSSRIEDTPLDVVTATGVYRPQNYDRVFRGLVTARVALAASLNVPAVRTLQRVGVEPFVRRLAALGFGALARPDYYGESLALGSADVSLLELVRAYRALARGGAAGGLRLLADAPAPDTVPVMDARAVHQVARILSDRESRSGTFGFESPLASRAWTAVKTGTSKDMRDNWCVGFSSDYTVGVWVGNFSGEPMWNVSGIDGAAPTWLEIVEALHAERPSRPPSAPPGLERHGDELYLPGTAPFPPVAVEATRPPRIRAPADGTVVALDPDIPDARERMFLESDPPDPDLRFRLDGTLLGPADRLRLWAPRPGRHRLELVDAAGRAVDGVRFEVR